MPRWAIPREDSVPAHLQIVSLNAGFQCNGCAAVESTGMASFRSEDYSCWMRPSAASSAILVMT